MKTVKKIVVSAVIIGIFIYVFNFEYFGYFLSLIYNSAVECVTGGDEYSNQLVEEMDTLKISKFISLKVNGKEIDLDNTDFGEDFYNDIVDNMTENDITTDGETEGGEYSSETPERLYSFGNKTQPRGARPKQDFGVDDFNDIVGPETGKFPKGASNVNDIKNAPLSGHYYVLPKGTVLPDGLGIKADGSNIFPDSPHGVGHYTIFPTKEMTVAEFNKLYKLLPWSYGGKK